jgi:hypothetical protein
MKPVLPIWSVPLLLVVLAVALLVGNLSTSAAVVAAVETLGYTAYLLWRGRGEREGAPAPVANVLALLPGHLLLLLAVSLVPRPGLLAWLWSLLLPASIAYDVVTLWMRKGNARTSILATLYCIIWADLFVLLDRVIAIKRAFARTEEVIAASAFGLIAILFLAVGVFRHVRAAKE